MALSHIRNSVAGRKNWEAVTDNLFRVTFIPPQNVTGSEILSEQVISVSGWTFPHPEATQQQYKQARRNFASNDVDDTQNIMFTFELNLNDQFQNYVYNTIQDWRYAVRNPHTGELGLKKDYVGTIIVESYAADGTIFWVRTLKNVWPSGELSGPGQNHDVTNAEPARLEQSFTADYFEEERL